MLGMAQPLPRPRSVPAAAGIEATEVPAYWQLDGVQLGADDDERDKLGNGAYAEVRKASVPCAAKILHEVLAKDQRYPRNRERFAQECRILWSCVHPNIVRFYGASSHPKTGQTVLLMELLNETLTEFLEVRHAQTDVPYYLQLNIGHDIANGVRYLHSQHIIHRDLSSNNVLLSSPPQFTAKISDFGVSLLKNDPRKSLMTQTRCPGTPVYMPPEALLPREVPSPTEKMDSFQIGVLLLQIATKLFPAPTAALAVRETTRVQDGHSYDEVPERVRRESHIAILRQTEHPLLDNPILECLENRQDKRPTAELIMERLSALMSDMKYLKDCESKAVSPRNPQAGGGSSDKSVQILKETVGTLREENDSLRQLLEMEKEAAERERVRGLEERRRAQLQADEQVKQAQAAEQRRTQALEYELQQLKTQQSDSWKAFAERERLQQNLVAMQQEIHGLQEICRQQQDQIHSLHQEKGRLTHHNSQLVQQAAALQAALAREKQARQPPMVNQPSFPYPTHLPMQQLRLNQPPPERGRDFTGHSCRIVGHFKKSLTAGQRGTVQLEVCDPAGTVLSLTQQHDFISAHLVTSGSNPVQCRVTTRGKTFEISFAPQCSGHYWLSVNLGRVKLEKLAFFSVYPDPKYSPVPKIFIGSGDNPLKRPCSLAVNSNRELLVCEKMGNCVSVYDIANPHRPKRKIGEKLMEQPTGVAVDDAGDVYVTSRHQLQKFSGDTGVLVNTVGHAPRERNNEREENAEFHFPNSVKFHKGEVFVADQNNGRIRVFDVNLTHLRTVTGRDGNAFVDPSDVAFDNEGRMYVAEHGAGKVQVFSLVDGRFLQTIERKEREMKPTSIHVVNEYLYVSDLNQSVLVVFRTSGEFVGSLGSRGYGKGEWSEPEGMTSSEGKIFVCGSDDGHVHVF